MQIQEIAAKAVDNLRVNGSKWADGTPFSCNAIWYSCYRSKDFACITSDIKVMYQKYSGAKTEELGFYDCSINFEEVTEETQNYRLEMLYYFWMANQDM